MTPQSKALFKYYLARPGEGAIEDYNLTQAAKALEDMTYKELIAALGEVKIWL